MFLGLLQVWNVFQKLSKFWFYNREACISIMGSDFGTNGICMMQSSLQFSQDGAFSSKWVCLNHQFIICTNKKFCSTHILERLSWEWTDNCPEIRFAGRDNDMQTWAVSKGDLNLNACTPVIYNWYQVKCSWASYLNMFEQMTRCPPCLTWVLQRHPSMKTQFVSIF